MSRDKEATRQAFEDHCWQHYLAQRAGRELPGDVDGEPTREGLFWRTEDGRYGVLHFNTAWCWAITWSGGHVSERYTLLG